ncbi:NAD-dependent epimerase/dehydratase family protein [Modestobacter altitudinis]|uniref:NAD-dependent epimerase/dehydratase family protein n=1 Tax=Modestobacter altitudinis TaxID=2213158 RepID=UPI00110C8F48|nr:NAD(P)-dependent oxidoreductase [Modestobacter altitudinis]
MKVVIAGATGAVGAPLALVLHAAGHEVIGVSRSEQSARRFAAVWTKAIVADALDRDALLAAARGVRADVVVHELTAIDGFPARHRDLDPTNRLRMEGTRNLLALAEQVGATRIVTQSFFGGYGYRDHRPALDGDGRITESAPFAVEDPDPRLERIIAALREAEQLTLSTRGLDGVALRYGALYGGSSLELMVALLRKRRLPVPRGGGGVLPFLYLPDAATATAAAIEHGAAGQAYNVCDDRPEQWGTFLDEAARTFAAPRPMRAPSWVFGLLAPYGRAFMTSSIPMSNAKLERDTGWTPAAPTIRDGLEAARAATTTTSGSAG